MMEDVTYVHTEQVQLFGASKSCCYNRPETSLAGTLCLLHFCKWQHESGMKHQKVDKEEEVNRKTRDKNRGISVC